MDNRASAPNAAPAQQHIHELFSRGNTPPIGPVQQPQPHHHMSSSQIDSLFQHLGSAPSSEHSHSQQSFTQSDVSFGSNPTTPMNDDQALSSPPTATQSLSERHNVLLSMLTNPPPAQATAPAARPLPATQQQQQQQPAQQIPTPPGSSSQRSNASPPNAEMHGKFLLEQLMSGNPPRSTYSDSPQSSHNVPITHVPSPPYPSHDPSDYRSYNVHSDPLEVPDMTRSTLQPPPPPQMTIPQQPQSQQIPPQKSIFDFDSPFDALSSTKKKNAPPQPSAVSSADDSSSWTAISAASDPKRRSVDNLLEQMTSSLRPYPQSTYDIYDPMGSDYTATTRSQQHQEEPPRALPPPIPPKPAMAQRQESPPPAAARASPPKGQAQRARLSEPSAPSQQGSNQGSGNGRRDKESSPGPRGSVRRGRGGKNFVGTSSQPQTIVFDVSQPHEEIQASRDFVKSTAIALVKQETVFLPGTTIGATHWVAYAMSRGRVRVISRSNGDRTLLQLPPVFGNASVSDMAVHGNRLAGVTTDGGFVVWELPDVITDDVPGHLILCVAPPTSDVDPLMAVKWHPKEPDTLAVASDNQIYLIDLANVAGLHDGHISQSELRHIGHSLTLSSSLVSFDFDILQQALITISVDSVLTTWNITDQVPYSSHKLRGDDMPSSLTYADGVIVVGRRYGTVFQLLSANTKAILSTIKFVNSSPVDDNMFGHVCFDSRIQTLWIANSKRESIIAVKLNMDSPVLGDEPGRGFIDQVVEFTGPKPTIHFVILTAAADPRGDEAYAACIAANITPSELALAGFSVHSSGVDQIIIRKEWFLDAMASTHAKYPSYSPPSMAVTAPPSEPKVQKLQAPPPRPRTPQSEEVDVDIGREDPRGVEPRGQKNQKGKNVSWGAGKEDNGKGKDKDKESSDAPSGPALAKEMKKFEDSLHTRITRTLNKEMDKQHQRFEDARAHEQAEDFARQEKILKLISTELTRNTTRVVEVAVKTEVQNSVLPTLENITKSEVKNVVTEQVTRGMSELLSRRLPVEMEAMLMRPEFTNKLAQTITTSLSHVIDRQVKEVVSQVVVPEIIAIKSDLSRWQNETNRSQEASISRLERTVQSLSDQVKLLSTRPLAGTPPQRQPPPPQPSSQQMSSQMGSQMGMVHGPPLPPVPMQRQPIPTMSHPTSMAQVPQQQQPQPQPQQQQPQPQHQQPPPPPPNWYPQDAPASWYPRGIAAPQPSHPVQPPPVEKMLTTEEMSKYEDQFLEALTTTANSPKELINLLARSNIDVLMPLRPDAPTLSQTVVIVIIHRNTSIIETSAPSDMTFKVAMQWLKRALLVLRLDDNMMVDYIPKVMPTTYRLLGIVEKRLALLPDLSQSTQDGLHQLREVRSIIEQKIPSATKHVDVGSNAGSANAGQV